MPKHTSSYGAVELVSLWYEQHAAHGAARPYTYRWMVGKGEMRGCYDFAEYAQEHVCGLLTSSLLGFWKREFFVSAICNTDEINALIQRFHVKIDVSVRGYRVV